MNNTNISTLNQISTHGRTRDCTRTRTLMLLALVTSIALPFPARAQGIPVIDANNTVQTTISAIENVEQSIRQISQYQLQLQQYENQLMQSRRPTNYQWNQATQTMTGLINTINTNNYIKRQFGGTDQYLNRTQTSAQHQLNPCLSYQQSGSQTQCSTYDRQRLKQNEIAALDYQKVANDAQYKGIDRQNQQLQFDADHLEKLQQSAQTAGGRMEALQYANQLASHQAGQLLELRSLLLQQQTADSARQRAQSDKELQQAIASESFRRKTMIRGQGKAW